MSENVTNYMAVSTAVGYLVALENMMKQAGHNVKLEDIVVCDETIHAKILFTPNKCADYIEVNLVI